jgi:NAD(P)-binding Rossmann-like domain
MSYDIIIIGAGAAGLYMAHKLKAFSNTLSMVVLESKQYVGGRTRMFNFANHLVPSGAYGINTNKDMYMINLLQSLGIEIKSNLSTMNYDHVQYIDNVAIINEMAKKLTPENCNLNSKTFMTEFLGVTTYNAVVRANSYSDFDLQCITDTITHYAIEDNTSGNYYMGVKWNDVWETLAQNFEVELGVLVQNIISHDGGYGVVASDKVYYGKNIIIATDILSVKTLLPMCPIYNQIQCQPFIRIYAVFNSKGRQILKQYVKNMTLVSGPLQSISGIDDDKGLYMIAYSDNANAELLSYYTINNDQNRHIMEDIVTKALSCPSLKDTITDLTGYYKYPGTHYYTCNDMPVDPNDVINSSYQNRVAFLHEAQRPLPNIFVVGEAVGLHQGWVESALISVETIFDEVVNNL